VDNKVEEKKDEKFGAFIGGLSNNQKAQLRKALSEYEHTNGDINEEIIVTNKTEKKLPNVVPTIESNPVAKSSDSSLTKKSEYIETRQQVKQVGVMNKEADTTIYQSPIPDVIRNESKIIPNKVIKHPLTEDRGGSQSEGDILDQKLQVATKFFDPNTRGNAEAKYDREGGRVKHGSPDSMVTAVNIKEGGQIAKGFNPNTISDSKKNPFLYLITGFNVQLDGKSIGVNQGFDSLDQAKSSVDEKIFMIHYDGKLRISKIIEGTPSIKGKNGQDLFVYNDSRWKEVK